MEPNETPQPKLSLSELLAALGEARQAASSAYEGYKELKGIEDQLRYELEITLKETGLKSAKGEDFSASISETPRVVVVNEQSVIDWLQNTPDVEGDRYVGLKTTEFSTFAKARLKGTGEVIPGTEVRVAESLSIKANPKKKEVK